MTEIGGNETSWKMMCGRPAIFIIMCWVSFSAYGENVSAFSLNPSKPESNIYSEDISSHEKASRITKGKKVIARHYINAVSATDNFLSGRPLEREINESYIKLESRYTYFSGQSNETGVSLSGKVDLPNTEKRLKLFFDSDDDTNHSLEERSRPVTTGEQLEKESSILGLELSREPKLGRWHLSGRAGAKMRSVPRAYYRIQLRRSWQLAEDLEFKIRNNIWYLASSGPGDSLRFELQRDYDPLYRLRLISELEYRDEYQTMDFLVQSVFSQTLSERASIHYRIGRLSNHIANVRRDKVFLAFNYRRLLYSDWVYFSLTPEIYRDPLEGTPDEHTSLTATFEFFVAE